MYAIGGSANPTINSQGNVFIAGDDNSTKEVNFKIKQYNLTNSKTILSFIFQVERAWFGRDDKISFSNYHLNFKVVFLVVDYGLIVIHPFQGSKSYKTEEQKIQKDQAIECQITYNFLPKAN